MGKGMSKREAAKLAKLIRKNVGKIADKQTDRSTQYDDTLRRKAPEVDDETRRFFKDMKRREF
ncbi:MAG TPA: hypothetical protein VI383_02005 [Gemmatimonadales bacterium]|nr:hypothetical protein [Gemmatimonadales bacterium]